jgi:hypothetical protein
MYGVFYGKQNNLVLLINKEREGTALGRKKYDNSPINS